MEKNLSSNQGFIEFDKLDNCQETINKYDNEWITDSIID